MIRRIFVDTPLGQVHCRTEGEGEPVVLLHQTPCSSDEYSEVIPVLSPWFRVIAMDTPAYGDSYLPAVPPNIEDYALVVLDVLDALGIQKAHMAGHHTGAAIAVELAAQHAERVQRIVLSGCPSWTVEEGQQWARNPIFRPLEITRDGRFMRFVRAFTLQRIPIPADRIGKAYDYALDYVKAGTRAEDGHQAAFRYDILSKLARIKQPALAMCGRKDILFQYHHATLAHVPDVRGYVIDGADDMVLRLLPREWAETALHFLKA